MRGDPILLHAACALGLEEALVAELGKIGAEDVRVGRGGVNFTGDARVLSDALLRLRSAVRIASFIAGGRVNDSRDLGDLAASVDWRRHLRTGQTISCEATARDSCFNHTGYAALVVKDGLVDRLRRDTGGRPDVDGDRPDLLVKAIIRGDSAELWRDESGESLHKRGYRARTAKSPLNEALAAGLLLLTGYDGSQPIADPMCGSGTFVIEAAMIALRRAPGLIGRDYAYVRRPEFDRTAFSEARRAIEAEAIPSVPFRSEGSDRHPGAVALARRDAEAAGVADACVFVKADAAERTPENGARLIYTNPPYGIRLEEGGDPGGSWKALGGYLRRVPSSTAFVLCGAPELSRLVGMKASRRYPAMNGQLECRLLRYDVFAAKPDSAPVADPPQD